MEYFLCKERETMQVIGPQASETVAQVTVALACVRTEMLLPWWWHKGKAPGKR